jgi:hypothetical protein
MNRSCGELRGYNRNWFFFFFFFFFFLKKTQVDSCVTTHQRLCRRARYECKKQCQCWNQCVTVCQCVTRRASHRWAHTGKMHVAGKPQVRWKIQRKKKEKRKKIKIQCKCMMQISLIWMNEDSNCNVNTTQKQREEARKASRSIDQSGKRIKFKWSQWTHAYARCKVHIRCMDAWCNRHRQSVLITICVQRWVASRASIMTHRPERHQCQLCIQQQPTDPHPSRLLCGPTHCCWCGKSSTDGDWLNRLKKTMYYELWPMTYL